MKDKELQDLAKDLVDVRDEIEPLMSELRDKFHEIMRKNGVKWGVKIKGQAGCNGANKEWTMSKDAFIMAVVQALEWALLFDTPEDLMAYDEEVEIE